jgi:hypothetical protein
MDPVNSIAIHRYWKMSNGGQESEGEAVLCCRVWRENELKVCGITAKLKVCRITFGTSCI